MKNTNTRSEGEANSDKYLDESLEKNVEDILFTKAVQYHQNKKYQLAIGTLLTILDFYPKDEKVKDTLLDWYQMYKEKLPPQTITKIKGVYKEISEN